MSYNSNRKGSIVLVAKCPIAGKSKTRLISKLGAQGSSDLARAMLSDVLSSVAEHPVLATVDKILLYAPGTEEGAKIMSDILSQLKLSENSDNNDNQGSSRSGVAFWHLEPMKSSNDLHSSDLGDILQDALMRARSRQALSHPGPVVFIGMDSPEVPLEEVAAALGLQAEDAEDREADTTRRPPPPPPPQHVPHQRNDTPPAWLCPAADGGYGLLSVPSYAPASEVFRGIRWSVPLTAVSQLKALTDAGVSSITIGRLMHDIDEAKDVKQLADRLRNRGDDEIGREEMTSTDKTDCLLQSSIGNTHQTGPCRYTRAVLMKLEYM